MMSGSKSFCQYLPSNTKKTKKTKKPPNQKVTNSFVSNFSSQDTHTRKKKRRGDVEPPSSSRRIENRKKSNWWKSDSSKLMIVEDYNIFHIDSKIREKLISNISTVDQLTLNLEKILWIMKNGEDPVEKIYAKRQASLLRKRIQDLESTLELAFYTLRTADILGEYRTMIRTAGTRSFASIGPTIYDTNAERMDELLHGYLCIAQDYVDIKNLSVRPKKMVCPACQCLEFHISPQDDSIYICCDCGTEVAILDDAPSFKDTDRVNMANKYTYTRKGHFIDAVKKFQGIQNTDPKKIKDAVAIVQREMVIHGVIAEKGYQKSVSKDHVYQFLSEQGLSGNYDDLNLIYHIITGEDCPNISPIVEDLYNDFDQLEEVLCQIIEEDRTNSLTVNYKLYKLLQRRGFPCRKNDFYILKTKTKEDEHDEKMKEAWDMLGWDWIPTF